MGKTAFLFPGQGAQYAGMGADFCERYREAGEIYDKALRNQKYTEDEDELILEGKDKKTGKKIVVYYEFKGDNPDVTAMKIDGEDKSYSDWYKYMTSYID